MKNILITTIAAVLVVGCGGSQSSEPPTAEAPDISIHDAAEEGNIEAVKQHLAAGTDMNARGVFGGIPLHQAAWNGHKEVIELLIDAGTDVDAKGESGETPLHHAAFRGHKEIAELLIANDADVNAKDIDGTTPLDLAIGLLKTETAALLRKHGGKTREELKAEGK